VTPAVTADCKVSDTVGPATLTSVTARATRETVTAKAPTAGTEAASRASSKVRMMGLPLIVALTKAGATASPATTTAAVPAALPATS